MGTKCSSLEPPTPGVVLGPGIAWELVSDAESQAPDQLSQELHADRSPQVTDSRVGETLARAWLLETDCWVPTLPLLFLVP